MTTSSPEKFKAFPDKWDFDSVMEHVIINYRWIFVLFLLPVSFCYDVYHAVRSIIVFQLNTAPTKHQQKVQNVQAQVKAWKQSGMEKPMCTARPGNTISLVKDWIVVMTETYDVFYLPSLLIISTYLTFLGWQHMSPQNMMYKTRMHGIHINLVDILEIDTIKR